MHLLSRFCCWFCLRFLSLNSGPNERLGVLYADPVIAGLHSSSGATFDSSPWPAPLQVNVVDDCGEPMIAGSVDASFSFGDLELGRRLVVAVNGRLLGRRIGSPAAR